MRASHRSIKSSVADRVVDPHSLVGAECWLCLIHHGNTTKTKYRVISVSETGVMARVEFLSGSRQGTVGRALTENLARIA